MAILTRNSRGEMPFLDHLEELRWRILWSLLAIFVGSVVGYFLVLGLGVLEIQLNDILIRNINLPEKLKSSIEKKLQQEQEALEYEFKIDKERLEATRKRIEAQGIQDFQKIITESINDKLLKWNGIEATLKLAESNNAKVIVIGSGKDGLPLILGGN